MREPYRVRPQSRRAKAPSDGRTAFTGSASANPGAASGRGLLARRGHQRGRTTMCKTTKLMLVLGGAFLACASGVVASRVARATPPRGVTQTLLAGPVVLDEIDIVTQTPT